ncbi:GXWXG domain-containing protein [Rhizobium sp. ZK1]|uniref:GXWXG domain-containing protein n=1 Tax=Rhizobium sp. ZK1 TaxID=3389872 RepID=UPI0039F6B88A
MIMRKGELVQTDLQKDMAAWFQSLEPVDPIEMIGLWRGAGIPSGHPLDGVLENLGWFGKRFHPDRRADPLLFQWRPGRLVAIDPRFAPIGLAIRLAPLGRTSLARNLFSHLQKAFRAKGTTAALEVRTSGQIASAAMIYDAQPIVDHFRRVADDTLAGMMCVRDDERRFYFKLTKIASQT